MRKIPTVLYEVIEQTRLNDGSFKHKSVAIYDQKDSANIHAIIENEKLSDEPEAFFYLNIAWRVSRKERVFSSYDEYCSSKLKNKQ
ncbi:MAG: hypothetical protein ACXAC8_03985 [Candidatus Hodarchaeales archaeon]